MSGTRFNLFVTLTLVSTFGCNALTSNANQNELTRLQGTWDAVMYEESDKMASGNGGLRITIAGNRFAVSLNDRTTVEGTLRIDASTSPKTIDFIDDKHVGTGIYQFYGDELKICYDPVGAVRPKRFEVTPESAMHLLVLTRGKS
jgi:uncharacterized protein (TIGR03067 family)